MLQVYTNTTQTVGANSPISFNTVSVNTNNCVEQTNATSFELNKPGYYLIHFNGIADATAIGDVNVQLVIDGVVQSYAQSSVSITAVSDLANLSFETIVPIKCSCCAIDNTKQLVF